MEVKLKHYTPLWVASESIRTAWASEGLSDWEFITTCKNCGANDEDFQRLSDDEQDIAYDDELNPFTYNLGDANVSQCNTCGSEKTECKKVPGPKDKALIHKVGNKFRHASTLEHINYHFDIKGISRALLQELARHRIASLTVKSTRYTLKELKEEEPFVTHPTSGENVFDLERAEKYLVLNENRLVNFASVHALENLRKLVASGVKNDVTKYALPESYKTGLRWTINMRSLQNFLELRTAKGALHEIRVLAHKIFDELPEDHKYMLEEFITEM